MNKDTLHRKCFLSNSTRPHVMCSYAPLTLKRKNKCPHAASPKLLFGCSGTSFTSWSLPHPPLVSAALPLPCPRPHRGGIEICLWGSLTFLSSRCSWFLFSTFCQVYFTLKGTVHPKIYWVIIYQVNREGGGDSTKCLYYSRENQKGTKSNTDKFNGSCFQCKTTTVTKN